jgi:hypothetical protein
MSCCCVLRKYCNMCFDDSYDDIIVQGRVLSVLLKDAVPLLRLCNVCDRLKNEYGILVEWRWQVRIVVRIQSKMCPRYRLVRRMDWPGAWTLASTAAGRNCASKSKCFKLRMPRLIAITSGTKFKRLPQKHSSATWF